jgi:hypothetical protein
MEEMEKRKVKKEGWNEMLKERRASKNGPEKDIKEIKRANERTQGAMKGKLQGR